MSATPSCQRIESAVLAEFPDARFGRFSCRHVGSSLAKIWSQHAASESNKYFGNALDITHKDYGYSSHPLHQIWLLRVKAFIRANFDDTIRLLLAPGNRAHSDHVHVDTFPKMEDTPNYVPPCKGGTLVVVNKDGSLGSTFGDAPPPPPPPTMEDDVILQRNDFGWAVARIQEGLLAHNPNALPIFGRDKDFGAETEAAVAAFQQGQNLDDAQDWDPAMLGKVDGQTAAHILRWNPVDGHNHDGEPDYAPVGHGHPAKEHDHDDDYAAKVHPHQVPGQTIT